MWSTTVCGGVIKASVAQTPTLDEQHSSHSMVKLVEAIADELHQPIKVYVVPFKRSLHYLKTGKVDFHLPLIQTGTNPVPNIRYSKESLFQVSFVLYRQKDKPINTRQLATYYIETEDFHRQLFAFDTAPSSCLECSLRNVQMGRIDAFLYADTSVDPTLSENPQAFSRVHRQYFASYPAKVLYPKSLQGRKTEQLITAAIKSLKRKNKLQAIIGRYNQPFRLWQPANYGY